MLEAIENSLAYCASVVRKDILTLARPRHGLLPSLFSHLCCENSSVIRCHIGLGIWHLHSACATSWPTDSSHAKQSHFLFKVCRENRLNLLVVSLQSRTWRQPFKIRAAWIWIIFDQYWDYDYSIILRQNICIAFSHQINRALLSQHLLTSKYHCLVSAPQYQRLGLPLLD